MPRLEVRSGRHAGKGYDLSKPVILGRGETVDVPVPDTKASREHCRVFAQAGVWVVADLNSRNGILVNGVKTTRKNLKNGDRIEIGETAIEFVEDGAAPAAGRAAAADVDVDAEVEVEIEDESASGPAPAAPARPAASQPPRAQPPLRETTAKAPGGAKPAAKKPAQSAKDAAFAEARAAAAQKAAAKGAAKPAAAKSSGAKAGGGGETGIQVSDKVLQYNRVDMNKASPLGLDMSQYSVATQLLIWVAGIGLVALIGWLVYHFAAQ